MPRAKTVADILTATRLLLAIYIFLLGIFVGREALGTVTMVMLLAWTTDVLDGSLARRDTSGRKTWWDDKDFPVDGLLVLALFLYLALSRFITPWFAILYLLVAMASTLLLRSQSVTMSFMAPVLALALYLALREAPIWGWATIVWCIIALATNPHRFIFVVTNFIAEMRELQTESNLTKTSTNNSNKP